LQLSGPHIVHLPPTVTGEDHRHFVTRIRVPMGDVFVFVLQASIVSAIIGLIAWALVILFLAAVIA
jgi:hypothetical protein